MKESTIKTQLADIFDRYDHPVTEHIADDLARAAICITTAATAKNKQLPYEYVAIRSRYKDDSAVSADLLAVATLSLDLVEIIVKSLRDEVKHVA